MLDGPECPDALHYLWGYFCEISAGLSSNGFGPPIVTWEALRAWCEFMAVALAPWEARALVVLGHVRATVDAEEQEKRAKRGGKNQNR